MNLPWKRLKESKAQAEEAKADFMETCSQRGDIDAQVQQIRRGVHRNHFQERLLGILRGSM